MKKRRLKKGVKIALVLIAVLALAGTVFRLWPSSEDSKPSEDVNTVSEPETKTEEPAETVEEEPQETTTSATLFMVGDGLLHGAVIEAAQTADGGYDFNQMVWRIGAIARNYDLRYYNQETILGGTELGLSSYPLFNSPQEFGRDMVEEGFNLVSTATNHTADYGEAGVESSWNFWHSQEGVVMEGTNLSQEERDTIRVHEVNGISYAFLSWTFSLNGLDEPYGREYMINCYDGHRDEMLDQVRRADALADVVITAIHWGVEYQMYPSDEQIILAQELADAGCDIIIGNHPHVIGPVEWLNDHKTLCYYALGNMISAQFDDSLVGMMGACTITKTVKGDETNITISDAKADLIWTKGGPIWWGMEVIPFSQLDDSIFPGYMDTYNRLVGVINWLDDDIQVGGILGQ